MAVLGVSRSAPNAAVHGYVLDLAHDQGKSSSV
jgi:hypothetical protein